MNDPTSYYTADHLLSVDGCICDKVRVVLDERTGELRRDYRNDETKEYGDMMNMSGVRRPAQIQNVLAQGGIVPLRPVRQAGDPRVLDMSSTPTSGRRLFCRRKGRSARIIRKIKRCRCYGTTFERRSRGRGRRACRR